MNKLLAISIVLVLTVLTGCRSLPAAGYDPAPASMPAGSREPPANKNWIAPGKVEIAGFHPGERAEYPLTIHAGNKASTFRVYFKAVENTPPEAENWVTIAGTRPVIEAGQSREVMIALEMPVTVNPRDIPDSWEFQIAVSPEPTGTGGSQVVIELASRWIIAMK